MGFSPKYLPNSYLYDLTKLLIETSQDVDSRPKSVDRPLNESQDDRYHVHQILGVFGSQSLYWIIFTGPWPWAEKHLDISKVD